MAFSPILRTHPSAACHQTIHTDPLSQLKNIYFGLPFSEMGRGLVSFHSPPYCTPRNLRHLLVQQDLACASELGCGFELSWLSETRKACRGAAFTLRTRRRWCRRAFPPCCCRSCRPRGGSGGCAENSNSTQHPRGEDRGRQDPRRLRRRELALLMRVTSV